MSLEDLIEQRKGSAGEVGVGAPPAADGAPIASSEPRAPADDSPRGVASVVTPSGLEIYYQAAPKRLYRIRETAHAIETDWFEVPSVSTVNGVLEKGGLSWWGMKVGIAGSLVSLSAEDLLVEWPHLDGPEVAAIVKRLQAKNLDVNKVRDHAADRGTNVHSALELYADTGTMPNPEFFPETERGYVEGLVAFLLDTKPRTQHSELMVGSVDGFAGRFDLVADIEGNAVTKTYPKRAPIRSKVEGSWLLDLKTSKDVYPSYHLQTAAYRAAMSECGYGEVDHAGILRVTADGRYELVEARATYEDFLSVLSTYKAIERIK